MSIRTRKTSRLAGMGAGLAALAMVAAGCGDDDDAGGSSDFLTMGTGSTGGTYFPLGGVMAQVWTNEIDGLRVSTQASGASVENLQLLVLGELDLAMAINGVASDALAGDVDLGGEDADITYIGAVYKEVNQIIARADAGITTVEDLAGKTVAIGPPGSGTAVFAEALLERAGIELGEARQETFGEAADLLRDGTIDASFGVLALPTGSLEEVALAVDLVLVSLEGDLLAQTLEEDPTLTEVAYDGQYESIDQPATLVTNWASLYARSDLDDDTACDLTRVLYENSDDIAAANPTGSEIQLETAQDGVADVPIHPGAQRFYDDGQC